MKALYGRKLNIMTLDELIIQAKSSQNQQQSIKNLVMAINFYSFAG